MAPSNDSTKTNKGSSKNSKQSSTSSNPPSDDHALAEHRIMRFESDHTPTTVPFHSAPNTTDESIIASAIQRMEAEILAFEISFGEPAAEQS